MRLGKRRFCGVSARLSVGLSPRLPARVFLLVVALGTTVLAQDEAVSRGCRFLLAAQASGGTWSSATPRERGDTLLAAEALQACNTTETAAAAVRGCGALLLRIPQPPVALPDHLVELQYLATGTPEPVLQLRNPDGGWGAAAALHSDPLDTAEAAQALLKRGATPAGGWRPTWDWLLANRLPDGTWDLSPEPASGRLRLTARLLRLFHAAERADPAWKPELDAALTTSLSFLRSTSRTDGRFSLESDLTPPVSCVDTAEALRAIVLYEPPALFADSASLLRSLQQPDGSWIEPGHPDQAVYTTATVLLALLAVAPPAPPSRPDLAVYAGGIQFQPASPAPGDAVTATVIVFNRGRVAAENVRVSLYLTEPRTGTPAPADTQTIAVVAPGTAGKVTFTLSTTDLTSAPRVFAWADPGGGGPDPDRTDNLAWRSLPLAGLPADTAPAAVDLAVCPELVTIEDRTDRTVRLGTAPALTVKAVIANLGREAATAFRVRIRAGGKWIASQTVSELAPGASLLVAVPWVPVPGPATVVVEADPEQAVPETDETNNRAEVAVTILGSAYDLQVKRWRDGAEVDPPLAAYDTARITASSPEAGTAVDVTIAGVNGTPTRTQPVPLVLTGTYQWNVVNQPPGTCTVEATFRDPASATVLRRERCAVDVQPTVRLRRVRASLSRSSVEAGAIPPIAVTVNLDNGANVDSTWALSWRVTNPVGDTVLTSTTDESVDLLAVQTSRQVTLAEPIRGTITGAGLHRVTVTAASPAAEPVIATCNFTVLPALRIEVTNSVAPAEVPPGSPALVHTELALRAVRGESDDSLPVAIGAIDISSTGDIPDRADAAVTVTARRIVASTGQRVADGTAVAVFVPYGRLSGGANPPGDPPNPQIRICHARNGEVNFTYAPYGGILQAGQHSVTVLEFHTFLSDTDRWYGNLIGTRELFFHGE